MGDIANMNPLSVGAPLPNSIGRCADLYAAVRGLRLQMDKEVEAVKARETEIREHIINNLSKSQDTGAAGLKYRAQIVMKRAVKVADWPVFHSWVRKNDRFDMLQKRLSDKAVADWMDDAQNAGRLLPGTEALNVPDVSITKI